MSSVLPAGSEGMAQMKAIATGAEIFMSGTIREVAAEKLQLVKPMLDALRSGDMRKLAQFEDIGPISIEDYAAAYASRLPLDQPRPNAKATLEEKAVLKLLELDIPPRIARNAVKKVLRRTDSGQPLSAVVGKAFRLALNLQEKETPGIPEPDDDDLWVLAGDNPYQGFKAAGVIADDAGEF